ncbi:hypothetical protein SCP_0507830 [Sparassis crispa]|uniref:Uncharacterized protein n=1 Tax=Sparassis crispa TaxID=139825 RepID=A0A401GNC0_9APHY|nr:hypothetical protein SCP_0507830 [Sparassis crispa]GBE83727.1 hypothetical protein SCP_0507830 [Sparassis crispa]
MSYYDDIQRPNNVYRVRRSSNGLHQMYRSAGGGYYDAPPEMRMVYQYNQPALQPQMFYRPPPMPYGSRITRQYRPAMCCDTLCGPCCDSCCPSWCGPGWCCCC